MKEIKRHKEIEVLKHFYELENSRARYILFRGSTRSGKTISIIQNLLVKLIKNKKIRIVIGVETLRSSRASLIEDLDEWIYNFGLINYFKINKNEFTYEYLSTGSVLRILPCDLETKWFGVKADIFWFNEATHIDKNFFEQAEMRLPDRNDFHNCIILDYNPTNPHSWVRDLELNENSQVFISTYKDNPFLGQKQVKLIESWKETNYNKWLVFGQGEYGDVRGAIYKNWSIVDEFPKTEKYYYGLDFGFTNDPTALVKVCLNNGEIYIDEIIYERGLTNQDIAKLFREYNISRNDEIICDSSEPKSIEELRREGFFVRGAKKTKNSILQGIDILQRYKINVTKRSKNIQDEIINYTWIEDRKRGEFINKPSEGWNHTLDALRYVALEKFGIKSKGSAIVFKTL